MHTYEPTAQHRIIWPNDLVWRRSIGTNRTQTTITASATYSRVQPPKPHTQGETPRCIPRVITHPHCHSWGPLPFFAEAAHASLTRPMLPPAATCSGRNRDRSLNTPSDSITTPGGPLPGPHQRTKHRRETTIHAADSPVPAPGGVPLMGMYPPAL